MALISIYNRFHEEKSVTSFPSRFSRKGFFENLCNNFFRDSIPRVCNFDNKLSSIMGYQNINSFILRFRLQNCFSCVFNKVSKANDQRA